MCPDGFGWSTLNTIKEMIEREIGVVALDPTEVTLVDRYVLNFLAACEPKGIELRNFRLFCVDGLPKKSCGSLWSPQTESREKSTISRPSKRRTKRMFKHVALLAAVAVILASSISGEPLSPTGSWQVDARHSDAQLSTDGTTNFGKTKTTLTIGFARVNGTVKLDSADSANSAFDFRMYPACSMAPPIEEGTGKVKIEWFTKHANNTVVCFHSKGTRPTADGRLQTTGTLTLTRVDRNVEVTPSEAYAGPVYGPPMVHRVSHEATFVFDLPAAGGSGQNDGAILASGSTKVIGEDFPQLLKTVIATYWPPVVQDENCRAPAAGEAYSGPQCTGTFLEAPAVPEMPRTGNEEDYPGPANFNAVVGNQLTILVHMRLTPISSGTQLGARK